MTTGFILFLIICLFLIIVGLVICGIVLKVCEDCEMYREGLAESDEEEEDE